MGSGAAHFLRLEAATSSHWITRFSSLALRFAALAFTMVALQSTFAQATVAPIAPPDHDFRTTERASTAGAPFSLVHSGKPNFSLVVADSSDEIRTAAAADRARYIQARGGSAPSIGAGLDPPQGNLVVLASSQSLARLP